MQDEHVFVWKAILDSVDSDLAGRRVLDIGCNQGGFLRLTYDDRRIAEGWGYDPASAAVADARRLAGERPLRFEVAERVPVGWEGFDAAFSHEVLYLLHDLRDHAGQRLRGSQSRRFLLRRHGCAFRQPCCRRMASDPLRSWRCRRSTRLTTWSIRSLRPDTRWPPPA